MSKTPLRLTLNGAVLICRLIIRGTVERSADEVLQDQRANVKEDGSKALEAMHAVKEIRSKLKHALENGNLGVWQAAG